VGASERGGNEWFNGHAAIREIIAGDWTYWGAVEIDVEGVKITVLGETAWFSTTGTLTSGDEYEQAYPFYLEQMRDLLMDEKKSLDDRLTDATYFGVNRLRDRMRGVGQSGPSSSRRCWSGRMGSGDSIPSTGRSRQSKKISGHPTQC
jgi:hypothetical protein